MFTNWSFHHEIRPATGTVRLVATNKSTGQVVTSNWTGIGYREAPYIHASALVAGAQGYIESNENTARHVLNTPICALGSSTIYKD